MENSGELGLKNHLDLSSEIASLGQIIKQMQELEEKKENAVDAVRELNHKFDAILSNLIEERDNISQNRNNLSTNKKEIMTQINKIYWFMFWRFLDRKLLNDQLKDINEQLKDFEGKLNENLLAQWEVKPQFQSECEKALDGIIIYFLNVGERYDDSNANAVRETFDREYKEIIDKYRSIIDSIVLKCVDYINKKTIFSPTKYASFYKVDIPTLLNRFSIIPDTFQSDILFRIESLIDDISNPIDMEPKNIEDATYIPDSEAIIKKKKL